jgi:aldehyde:ferredoxin oxidoreductase
MLTTVIGSGKKSSAAKQGGESMKGYMGKILRVNLSQQKVKEESLDPHIARQYLGGVGIATKILYDEVPKGTDPLSEKNKIIFFSGVLTGTGYPGGSRFQVVTKSPLTGIWLGSSAAGFFGTRLKRAGYDGLIVEGISKKPVVIDISDEGVEFINAADIWGMDIFKSKDAIEKKVNKKKTGIVLIGPAGEKLVRTACIMSDEGRFTGRGGAGAVMGSKNLKGIVVSGNSKIEIADPEAFRMNSRKAVDAINSSIAVLPYKYMGTTLTIEREFNTGDVPVKNFQIGMWEKSKDLSGKQMAAKSYFKNMPATCYACPVHCSKFTEVPDGPHKVKVSPAPQYETLAALGANCLNHNVESVIKSNDLCSRYGMDTISTGVTISFIMEAYENGHITAKDLDGIKPIWGDEEVIIRLVRMIGEREGVGRLLGEGVKRTAEAFGLADKGYAVHVKGLEVPMHDPRASFSFGVNYATSPRGACHLRGPVMLFDQGVAMIDGGVPNRSTKFNQKGKGLAAKAAQDAANIIESQGLCLFCIISVALFGVVSKIAEALEPLTGETCTVKDLWDAGERISNLQRAFNIRENISAKDDRLPARLLEPFHEGLAKGQVPDIETHLKEYYQVRGWDSNGIPTQKTLKRLKLDWLIPDLHPGAS